MKRVLNTLWILLTLSLAYAWAPNNGVTTCPTSGNKRVASSSVRTPTYSLQTPISNTGSVCIGGSSVTTSSAICLTAGMSYTAPTQGNSPAYDLQGVYFACTVNTDVIQWLSQ